MKPNWTEEQIRMAKHLWCCTPDTSRLIAVKIGKPRSSLISKANRMGWVKFNDDRYKVFSEEELNHIKEMWYSPLFTIENIAIKTGNKRHVLRHLAEKNKWKKAVKEKKPKQPRKRTRTIKPKMEDVCMDTTQRIHLLHAKEWQCRDVVGDPKNMIVCGAKCVEGKSYCQYHCQRNLIPYEYTGRKAA